MRLQSLPNASAVTTLLFATGATVALVGAGCGNSNLKSDWVVNMEGAGSHPTLCARSLR